MKINLMKLDDLLEAINKQISRYTMKKASDQKILDEVKGLLDTAAVKVAHSDQMVIINTAEIK